MATQQPPEETTEPVHMDGFVKEGFEAVQESFKEMLEKESNRGGSFAAYYKGELVVDLWGGAIEKDADQYWQKDTLPCFFSTTKSISSITIAHLVDNGVLDYKEKIAKYWPEFGQNGKESITLETYMANRAGLCAIDDQIELDWAIDNDPRLEAALAKQTPAWEPDTAFGYHPATFALYLDQIVRKVDVKKRSLSQYFKDEIAIPFDIDFHIGLPLELFYKAPRLQMMFELAVEDMFKDFDGDKQLLGRVMANPKPRGSGMLILNNPYLRNQPIGSMNGHGTAEAVAKLHGILANGGKHNGKVLLSEEAIKRQQVPLSRGIGKTLGLDVMFSLGTSVSAYVDGNSEPKMMFGHSGFGGQLGLADPNYKVGLAFVSNHLHPIPPGSPNGDTRARNLQSAVFQCVYKLENVTEERRVFFKHSEFQAYEDSL